jgi:hypothetical protein
MPASVVSGTRLDLGRGCAVRFGRWVLRSNPPVVVGVDPHELSATIEVVDPAGAKLGEGRFGRIEPEWVRRVWAVAGANGAGPGGG